MIGLRRAVQRIWPSTSRRIAGQPTPETHPELLAQGELSPGVSAEEFRDRRNRLASVLPPGSVAIIPSADTTFLTGVIPNKYRQDADFRYLTGIVQPGVLAIQRFMFQPGCSSTLFVPNYDAKSVVWNGARLDENAAVEVFGLDNAYPMSELRQRLGPMVQSATNVLCDLGKVVRLSGSNIPVTQLKVLLQGCAPKALCNALHLLRWRKSPAELALMRKAAATSASAMANCMAMSYPGVAERVLSATFEYECKLEGAEHMAYPEVVAGGSDSCTIHYSRLDKEVKDGELILMDAGCELHGYASDVTRTWPVNGKFSGPQKDLYEMVLDIHRQCLHMCRVGTTMRAIHERSVELMTDGLREFRLTNIPGFSDYKTFYPHSVGHYLGLDTHDTSQVGSDRPLVAGVVVTVEPGVYVPNEEAFGPFAGIGIRIEDDVVISGGEPDVISAHVPVEVDDIESLVGSKVR